MQAAMPALLSTSLSRRQWKVIIPVAFVLFFVILVSQINRVSESSLLAPAFSSWTGRPGDKKSPNQGPYYPFKTRPFFPPLHDGANTSDLCAGFPTHLLDSVQIVLKTGAGDGKIHAHLNSVASCITNLLILSDLELQLDATHRSIDILADLPASYSVNNSDFDLYNTQKAAHRKGGDVKYSQEGWRLDRFKFLPMVERAYRMRPHADWYVFIESDTYFFWDTLFRMLDQLDPAKPHYMGSPVPGAHDRWFAYGGAGFVLSRGVMKPLMESRATGKDGEYTEPGLSARYEEWARGDCCGDAVLAYAIFERTGVRLKGFYPIFAGDELKTLKIDRERWCVPLLALHRVTPEEMGELWKWERTRPYDEKPFVHSTLLGHTHPYLLKEMKREGASRDFWDNYSDMEQPPQAPAHASAKKCAAACFADPECLQYSYKPQMCKFMSALKLGRASDQKDGEFTSGVDLDKMRKLGWAADDTSRACPEGAWIRPNEWSKVA